MLMKQFTSPELKEMPERVDLLHVQNQATRGSSDVSNKRVATPQGGSNQSSPLLSARKQEALPTSTRLSAQTGLKLNPIPLVTSIYQKLPTHVSFNESPILEVQESMTPQIEGRLSMMRPSAIRNNLSILSQAYMSVVDELPKETISKSFFHFYSKSFIYRKTVGNTKITSRRRE